MTYKQRKLRRQQIDAQLDQDLAMAPGQPRGGWLHAIREALGMTLEVFGGRLGVTRQAAHRLEQSEASESISIKRLRAAAAALDCELVIYLRPKHPLEKMVSDRAYATAREIVARAGHLMVMEDQAISDSYASQLVEETAADLIARGDNSIWQ